jgi:hypothetical protein
MGANLVQTGVGSGKALPSRRRRSATRAMGYLVPVSTRLTPPVRLTRLAGRATQ